MTHNPDDEPTHTIPRPVENALVEAKLWYDSEPPAGIGTRAGLEREEWERNAIAVLTDIVEAVESTWGFAG